MSPTTTSDVLNLLQREPGRPRLTWYGDGPERIELSGAVLANWVAKTTNLLVEELDAAAGETADDAMEVHASGGYIHSQLTQQHATQAAAENADNRVQQGAQRVFLD